MSSDERARLPAVFDDLNVGVTVHDPESGAIIDANERLEQLYGYSREELRSMTIGEITAPSTKFDQTKAVERIRAAADGTERSFDWQIVRESGEVRWIQVHLNATTLNGEACVIAEVHDITESRGREQHLRLLSRIIRHNLRNRSNVLIGFSERIKESVENDTLEEQVETLLDVSEEIGSLSHSVRELEEILELDATDRSACDLGEMVTDLANGFGQEHSSLEISVDADPEVWVMADRGLRYALEHAVHNAVEHGPDGQTVEISVDEDETVVRVQIADEGPLIPEEEIEVLNDEVAKSSTYHGSGVGLWVMQWGVSSIGGELSFDERASGGNVVTITLPKVASP